MTRKTADVDGGSVSGAPAGGRSAPAIPGPAIPAPVHSTPTTAVTDAPIKTPSTPIVSVAVAELCGGVTSVCGVTGSRVGFRTVEPASPADPVSPPEAPPVAAPVYSPLTAGGPISIYNAVKLANGAIQDVKSGLESKQCSNLKREIRDMITDRCHLLLQLVLRLSDDRHSASVERERERTAAARSLEVLRAGHAKTIEKQVARYSDFEEKIDQVLSEVKATRLIVGHYDQSLMPEQMKEIKTMISDATARAAGPYTYAGILGCSAAGKKESPVNRAPMHSIVVSSKDETDTSEDVLTKVRTAVDARATGLKVDRVRKARHQKLVVTCSNKEDMAAIKAKLGGSSTRLNVRETEQKNPLVMIKGVMAYNTDDQLLESLRKQNGKVMAGLKIGEQWARVKYRRKCRNPLMENIVLEVAPALWRRLTDIGWVHIDLQRRRVTDQSPLIQCTRCLGFGHSRRFCREAEDSCGHCGGSHLRVNCRKHQSGTPPACRNCVAAKLGSTDHDAFSEACPVRMKWDAIARQKTCYC